MITVKMQLKDPNMVAASVIEQMMAEAVEQLIKNVARPARWDVTVEVTPHGA